jgi:hypothetical protein
MRHVNASWVHVHVLLRIITIYASDVVTMKWKGWAETWVNFG